MDKKTIGLTFICMGFFGSGYFGRAYIDNHFIEKKQNNNEFIHNELIGEIILKTDSMPFTPAGYFTATDNEGRKYKINYDIINKEVAIKDIKLEREFFVKND